MGLIAIFLVPAVLFAQVERVMQVESNTDIEGQTITEVDSQRTYFEAIIVSTSSVVQDVDTQIKQDQEEKSESNQTVTTKKEEEVDTAEAMLSSMISDINDRYQDAVAACSTGSWLENIWCRIKWW